MINQKPAVILCIGSEKIAGDSLGPVVGDLLTRKYNVRHYVYGTTERSVNGRNYKEYIDFIKKVHPDSTLIAVDAALGREDAVGKIRITATGVNPKKAVTGKTCPVGDVGILGVVDRFGANSLTTLLTVPHDNIMKLGDKIAFMISFALA